MKFTKMHGIGNDYIYVDGFAETVNDPARAAREMSDRHFGIGGDGLILILPSQKADVRMRMYNADGSEAEMCGNGVRCVAKYVYDHGLALKNPMTVETGRGVLSLSLKVVDQNVREATVNMGEPILAPTEIPVDLQNLQRAKRQHEFVLSVGNERFDAVFVSMGNPHAVMFVDDAAAIDLQRLGPKIERHEAFPRRVNAHWAQVQSSGEVIMRTWERGSGITLACGTGACAVCVAGALTDRTGRAITAHLPGGDLGLEWREADNCVYMTGPAVEVFSGQWVESY